MKEQPIKLRCPMPKPFATWYGKIGQNTRIFIKHERRLNVIVLCETCKCLKMWEELNFRISRQSVK